MRDQFIEIVSDQDELPQKDATTSPTFTSNTPSPIPSSPKSETPKNDDEIAIDYIFTLLRVNYLLGFLDNQSINILEGLGFNKNIAQQFVDTFNQNLSKQPEGMKKIEQLTFTVTRNVIEKYITEGRTDQQMINKLVQSGFKEEIAPYALMWIKTLKTMKLRN